MDATKDRMTELYKQHGHLTPEIIVADAEDETSPLHPLFVWDDSTAAQLYRLSQGADLIRRVRITTIRPDGTPITVRAYASVPNEDEPESPRRVYKRIDDLLAPQEDFLFLMIKRDIANFINKLRDNEAWMNELRRQMDAEQR